MRKIETLEKLEIEIVEQQLAISKLNNLLNKCFEVDYYKTKDYIIDFITKLQERITR